MDDRFKDPLSKFIEAGRLANPFQEALRPLASYQLSYALTRLNPRLPSIERVLAARNDRLNGMLRALQTPSPWLDGLQQRIEQVQRTLGDAFPNLATRFGNIFKNLENLPEKARESVLAMAEAGWYLDLQMPFPDITDFKRVTEEDGAEVAETNMVAHFEERFDAIQAALITEFPHRKLFFDAAFDAIRRGQYILAIPVLLSQIDGICKDVAGEYFFIKAKGKGPERPAVADFVLRQTQSDLAEAFLCMVEEVRPIGLSEKRRAPDFKGLNRHTVMHGEDLEYGSEVNSLKAISLLNCLAQNLTRKLKDEDESDAPGVGDGAPAA